MLFFLSRIFSALFVMLGVMTLVFLLLHIVPGDPLEAMLGESATAADRENLRIILGLDKPLWQQWWDYVTGVLRGDFGHSLLTQKPVGDLLLEHLPATLQLTFAGLIVAILIALPLGSLAALYPHTVYDRGAMLFALLGMSIPHFWLAPLFILFFSLHLGWLPVSGRESLSALILPALTLGTALAAILARMIRATLLEVLHEDYIRTARAKGLHEVLIVWRHALRNAALPIMTIISLQLGSLLGGAVITETIFAWNGIGQLTVEAIQRRDYPVVQTCILFISLSYVVVNTFTDLLYAWLDPRVRYH